MSDKEIDEILDEIYPDSPNLDFFQTPWVIGKFLRGWQFNVPEGHSLEIDPRAFFESVRPQIHSKLEEELQALHGLKFQLALKVLLSKDAGDGINELVSPVLRHKQEVLLQVNEIDETINKAIPRILEFLEKWTQRGSGWVVDRVEPLWLDIARYQPLIGGSYIPLPPEFERKKAVITVKNKDDHCLRWALRSALLPIDKDPQRTTKYPIEDGLNFEGINSPTPVSQVKKVEKQNNLAMNVFGWDKGNVIIHHFSKQSGDINRINLLLIEKGECFHYTWIKDLNRLLYNQSKHRERKYFCQRCLTGRERIIN